MPILMFMAPTQSETREALDPLPHAAHAHHRIVCDLVNEANRATSKERVGDVQDAISVMVRELTAAALVAQEKARHL